MHLLFGVQKTLSHGDRPRKRSKFHRMHQMRRLRPRMSGEQKEGLNQKSCRQVRNQISAKCANTTSTLRRIEIHDKRLRENTFMHLRDWIVNKTEIKGETAEQKMARAKKNNGRITRNYSLNIYHLAGLTE